MVFKIYIIYLVFKRLVNASFNLRSIDSAVDTGFFHLGSA